MQKLILKNFLLTLLLFVSFGLSADNGYKSVVLVMNDDSVVNINLQTDISFSFDDDNLIIQGSDVNLQFALNNLHHWSYSTEEANTTVVNELSIQYVNENLKINNRSAASKVVVYDINGRKLEESTNSDLQPISFAKYRSGVYIVSADGKSFKIIKK